MIIATFNTNSIRSRLAIITEWLAENQPDVLALQETKAQDADFPIQPLEQTGYEFIFRGEKKYNGVAILSKFPIENASFGLDSEPADPARLAACEIKGIKIVNTYIPQGFETSSPKFQYKLDWFKRLGQYFTKNFKPEDKIAWVGDFNVAIDSRDVYDPDRLWGHVCYCQPVHEAVSRIMEFGFVDCFRKHNQKPGMYSFWDYRAKNTLKENKGWRLDYIMASKPLAKSCTNAWIDKKPRSLAKPSDHTPVLAEFKTP